jgi:hypothetical protein
MKDDDLDSLLRELIFATFSMDRPYEGTKDQRPTAEVHQWGTRKSSVMN